MPTDAALRPDVLLQEQDHLLVDLDSGRVLELNDTATAIVRALALGEADVVDRLQEAYPDAGIDRLAGDVAALLDQLRELGLLA